jgi:stage III sporulation protein SpoIIIAA
MQNLEIDGLEQLLSILPYWMRYLVRDHASTLEEICMDIGKKLCFKLTEGFTTIERVISQDDLEQVMCEVGMVRSDGRTGISGTLHRVAAITNRYGVVTGYTIRIGRYLEHVALPLREVVLKPKSSVALFGPPGSGKTTLLRGVASILANELGPRLCVMDSSNEIAGDGDTAHPLLKAARRLQVPDPKDLANKLIEALINHGPSVMLVDELARPEEVNNIIRIIQRGVRVIACLHGDTLGEVVRNPDYEPLLGIVSHQRKAKRQPFLPVLLNLGNVGSIATTVFWLEPLMMYLVTPHLAQPGYPSTHLCVSKTTCLRPTNLFLTNRLRT